VTEVPLPIPKIESKENIEHACLILGFEKGEKGVEEI
jgi:hypothetical protein